MNRRTFIKNGALGVGATALAGVATQDAEVAAQRITKWDRVADVVIAGAGASGLCAAIMARDQGASGRRPEATTTTRIPRGGSARSGASAA